MGTNWSPNLTAFDGPKYKALAAALKDGIAQGALPPGMKVPPVRELAWQLVQQFENTFVVPRILGEAVDLHPLIVMLGVLIGANVAGIVGALLAAPVIASGREITRYLYLKTLGQPPFPPHPEPSTDPPPSLWQQGQVLWLNLKGRFIQTTAARSGNEEDVAGHGSKENDEAEAVKASKKSSPAVHTPPSPEASTGANPTRQDA